MKRKLLFTAAILAYALLVSCKDNLLIESCYSNENELSEAFNAKEEFALILSKAVYSNENLRRFIKTQALNQFDKDYDVFYPWVKNEVVSEGQSFRDILKEYDVNDVLPRIEEVLPRLNILVPDWSWADGFSIKTWNTESQEVSTAIHYQDGLSIYTRGEFDTQAAFGQLPKFPVLIIKENERMRIIPSSKGTSDIKFDFINSEFNGLKVNKSLLGVSHEKTERTINFEDCSNFVEESELDNWCPQTINAYELFKNNDYAVHRDYIYYGMTNDITLGKRNVHVDDYLSKFRFETLDCDFLTDGNDYVNHCPDEYVRYKKIKNSVLISKFYYDGNLEIYIHTYLGNKDGSVIEVEQFKSVSFDDAFYLSKVYQDYRHNTWVSDPKWTFTVDVSCFLPRWINTNLRLPKWDISSQSIVMNIHFSEYDDESQETTTISVMNSYTNNFSTEDELALAAGFNLNQIANVTASGKVKVGYGSSQTETTTTSYSSMIKKGSDQLGSILLYYSDPVILTRDTLDTKPGFRVKEYDSDFVKVLILPRYE